MIVKVTNQRPFKGGWVTALLYFRERRFLAAIGVRSVLELQDLGRIAVGELLAQGKPEVGKYSSTS